MQIDSCYAEDQNVSRFQNKQPQPAKQPVAITSTPCMYIYTEVRRWRVEDSATVETTMIVYSCDNGDSAVLVETLVKIVATETESETACSDICDSRSML